MPSGVLSYGTAWQLATKWTTVKKPIPARDSRAWVEIDLDALRHNARVLQELLPEGCELMAVVKANAYGHGSIAVARTLNQSGVNAFAVATLSEGIALRKKGVRGEILILGFTSPSEIDFLVRYRLTQTIVDYSYAKAMDDKGKKVKVHIKIDTGMHRLGLDAENISELESIFGFSNLKVEGVFSHLCVSDSLVDKDVSYTQLQISQFYRVIERLRSKGYQTGKLHIQSSYGILNYPELHCDYARAGISLYGVLSDNSGTRLAADLKPVLSVRARIAMIRQITAGESVCYGRQYTAKADMKIAIVTIGYADGIPRNLSDADAYVLLRSKKAPIIGRICMDQLIIDVTHIENTEQNDIVTLIGCSGDEQVRCEDIAEKCGTIANEILSRLGNRLETILVNDGNSSI